MSQACVRLALFAALAPAIAGCGASDPSYYRLAIWPGAARPGGPQPVEVRSPTVASYLDRDYIVSEVDRYKLVLAGNDAWAEPIGGMIGDTLAGDLADRLPGSGVYAEGSAGGGHAVVRVALDVSRFDKDASGDVVLRGRLTVSEPDGGAPPRSMPLALTEPPSGLGTAGFVATLSRMLGEVADDAAQAIRALPSSAAMPDGDVPGAPGPEAASGGQAPPA